MYYEDENNLYHYSYPGHEKRETVREASFTPVEESAGTEAPKQKKRKGLRLAALILSCALVGGAAGGGIVYGTMRSPHGKTEIAVSDRQVSKVEQVKVDRRTQLTMPQVYAANIDSVVSINVSSTGRNIFGQVVQNAASGSGFLISKDGFIVTNHHVIEGASNVKVTLHDGTEYTAAIVGSDEDYDVAVIKIDGGEFTPAVIGDSSNLQIGDTIAAIGNPLGELTFSMSQGIVSCVDRAINVDGTPFNMIQVDCSINPGNSGGPLVNTYGEVVGIVSAKYMSYANSSVEGIGFAIPMNDVIALIEDIMTNGHAANKAYMGITPGTMTEQMAAQFRYDISKGVFVYSVEKGSAADKAGLQMGDVITKMDDTTIDSYEDLVSAKKKYSAGDTVKLSVYRGGETVEISLTFDAAPAEEEKNTEEKQQPQQQQPQQQIPGGIDPWNYFFNFGW